MTSWHCYFLFSTNGQTYIGATVDPDRRLRQHNGELVGGARATTMRVGEGQVWRRACLVSGFPDQRAALQFEWRWKSLSRKKELRELNPVDRRIQALHELIALDKPTQSAVPFADYPGGGVQVVWE